MATEDVVAVYAQRLSSNNPSSGESYRRWMFTIYDYEDTFVQFINDLAKDRKKLVELHYGLETCPTTGRKHIQGCLAVPKPCRRKALFKLLGKKFFCEPARQWDSCVTYCLKGGQPDAEHANPIFTACNLATNAQGGTQGARSDREFAAELIKAGGVSALVAARPDLYLSFSNAAEKLENHYNRNMPRRAPRVFWHYGPSGYGKTYAAFNGSYQPHEVWSTGADLTWFQDYNTALTQVAIFDDYRDDSFRNWAALLRLLDVYPYRVMNKGGSMNWNPADIYITSCFSPWEVYKGRGEEIYQLIRRINVRGEIREFVRAREYIVHVTEPLRELPPGVHPSFHASNKRERTSEVAWTEPTPQGWASLEATLDSDEAALLEDLAANESQTLSGSLLTYMD
jgi:hypothetical protein